MEPKSMYLENFFGVLLTVLLLSIIFPLHLNAQSYELYTAQGIQKINEEKFDEALELLKKALELSPENPEATYYTAIAYSRLGNYKEAEELFFKTLELDETALNVYLELGRIYYIKSQCDKTAIYLSKFTSRSDNELAKGYAMRLIDNCKEETKEETERAN